MTPESPVLQRLLAILPQLYQGDWKKQRGDYERALGDSLDDAGYVVLPPDYESILEAKMPS